MYSVCRISFEEIYDVWQTKLWPGMEDIKKLITLTIKDNKLVVKKKYISRYLTTVACFGLKYTSHYFFHLPCYLIVLMLLDTYK